MANTLYEKSAIILLDGELGAGKTTFLQGLAKGLGITQAVSSPTFALEQRYEGDNGVEFAHLDLYRLSAAEAEALLRESDGHEGLRCVEWASRVPAHRWSGPVIRVRLAEEGEGRRCEIAFEDAAIPSREQVEEWRSEMMLPPHIAAHCDAVARLCDALCENLLSRGIAVRPLALRRAAELHDLLRFVDFGEGGAPKGIVHAPEEKARWAEIRSQYPMRHEEACTLLLRERGYPAVAKIVETHGVRLPPGQKTTIEQKLLYYADKRAAGDRIVSIDERFEDFASRYGKGTVTKEAEEWLAQIKQVEAALFPDGAPRVS